MLDLPPQQKIIKLLLGLLPATEDIESAAEARLIFKFHSKSIQKMYNLNLDSVYQAVKSVMSNLVMLNLLKKDTDLSLETDRLYALMDGLAMNSMLQGTRDKPDKLTNILEIHMDSLYKEETKGQY